MSNCGSITLGALRGRVAARVRAMSVVIVAWRRCMWRRAVGAILLVLPAMSGAAQADQWQLLPGKSFHDFINAGYQLSAVVLEPGAGPNRSYYMQREGDLIRCLESYAGGNLAEASKALTADQQPPAPRFPLLVGLCYRLTAPERTK